MIAPWPLIAALAGAAAGQNASPAATCSAPPFRAFDFWLGEWRVFNSQGAPDGTARIESVPNGCAILEYRVFADGGVGTAINIFDSTVQKWSQLWASPGTVVRLEGAPSGTAMAMEGTLASGGGTRPLRVTWDSQPDGSVRQNFFVKGETAWKPLFHSLYVKLGPSRQDLD